MLNWKNEYFQGKDCLDVFVKKMNKILDNFENFPRQKIDMTMMKKESIKLKAFVTYPVKNLIKM